MQLFDVSSVRLARTLSIIEHVVETAKVVKLVDGARAAAAGILLELLWRLRRHGRHLRRRSHGSNRFLLIVLQH